MTAVIALVAASLAQPQCKTFRQIYQNGENLCNKMWGDAFIYTKPPAPAYSMWWVDPTASPNNAVTKKLHDGGAQFFGYDSATNKVGDCLDYFHKDKPEPHPELAQSVCGGWATNSCCNASTVLTGDKLNKAYGTEYHWDRCGKLSEQCRQFFVFEACLYECEPAASLFRKYPVHPDAATHDRYYNSSNKDHNKWELYKMPLKAAECDAWFNACADDKFCSSDSGNYFSCAREYREIDNKKDDDDTLAPGWIAVIVALVVLFCAVACYLAYIITREKQGKPVYYTPVPTAENPHGPEVAEMQPQQGAPETA